MFEPTKVRVETTRTPADGEAYFGFWEVLDYEWDDTNTSIRIPASAANPILIKEVVHIVSTGFTATATIDVGDGTDADFYIDTLNVAVDTVGDVQSSLYEPAGDSAVANVPGKYYTTNVEVKVTVGGTVSAGAGRLLVHAIRL